jgi:hypothetical protein
VKLVLQCAMCGTHHAVGTPVCSTCRASGVAQLRLMFECQSCGRLDLNPVCPTCPRPAQAVEPVYELDDDLIVAEEVADDPFALELDAIDAIGELALDIDEEGEADIFVVDESDDDSDFEDSELDSDFEGPDDADIEFDIGDEPEEDDFDQDEDEGDDS